MRIPSTLCIMAVLAALTPALGETSGTSPYTGQETRDIKALSPAEIADLANGAGMGLAKAAELNGYPGPRHALDMADALGLSGKQRQAVTAIFERMKAAAQPLGSEIIAKERDLDHRFAAGGIGEAELAPLTVELGELQGRLRAVHLAAHLETKAVLTAEQIAQYQALRGYAAAGAAHHPAMRHHSNDNAE
jgi:Spy/CpxP family protein refolding chaperone